MRMADPARPVFIIRGSAGELVFRILTALVLAPLALGAAYVGGWIFVGFWAAAALVTLWEWTSIVAYDDRRAVLMIGAAAVVLAIALLASGGDADGVHEVRLLGAITILAMGMLGTAALARQDQRVWAVAGIPYAGAIGIAPLILREDVVRGFAAMVFLFAVVWATDIVAFFVGRMVGGPRLAPRISPNKTWSGALGGALGAAGAAVAVAKLMPLGGTAALVVVAVALSIVAQAGDIFESALKRRFGVKDSSGLIPGHGGLMDRLDGFVAAAALAALIGLVRGGLEAPARGLLIW